MAGSLLSKLSKILLLQNGNLKTKIQGADTPLLSSQVIQLTPITADTDDLAVCITHAQHLFSDLTSNISHSVI